MRLSRWGRSPYETAGEIEVEAKQLGRIVDVLPEAADAEIVVVHSKIRFGAEALERAPSLRLLLTTTSGTDHIDVPLLSSRGILVARLPEARRDAVVDATIGMLIWGLRRFGPMHASAHLGHWVRGQLPGLQPVGLRGSRIGLAGLGVIGSQVARVLQSLGVEVSGSDPAGLPDGVVSMDVDEMMSECDAISLHCDLNESSNNLLSAERFERARSGLVVVNTARGSLLDVNAAVAAVQQGRLGALALDVFPDEPWGGMSAVATDSRILFTPHAAGYHVNLSAEVRRGLDAAVTAFVNGSPIPHTVNKVG